MSYNKNDRGGWQQNSTSDNNELKRLKRNFYLYRVKLILIEVAAFILMVGLLHKYPDSKLLVAFCVISAMCILVFPVILDSKKYKELIVEYLIREYMGDLQYKHTIQTGLTVDFLRNTTLWGNLEDQDMTLFHRDRRHTLGSEDIFSSKKHPFQFFESDLTLTKGSGKYETTETLFHGPVINIELPSNVDGLIVKTRKILTRNRKPVENDAPEIQALNLNSLWNEVNSISQVIIKKSPFAIIANKANLYIFFENKHNLFDPSFWTGASNKRIAEDTQYIKAMYEIGKLVCERTKL
ncbi:MAG: hypothetical protein KBT20_09265 [Bacteroidales bacterium]|nr:hypothetical protein [Candidatus Liminaster caballi]